MRSVFHFPWIILARYHVHTCCRPSCRGSWQICKADVHGFGNWNGLLSARPLLRSGNTFIALCKIPKRVLFNRFEIVILQPGLISPSTFLFSHWILICPVGWAVLAILSSTGSLEQESGFWGALRKHMGDEIKTVQLNMALGLAFSSDFAALKLMMCRSLPSKISFLLPLPFASFPFYGDSPTARVNSLHGVGHYTFTYHQIAVPQVEDFFRMWIWANTGISPLPAVTVSVLGGVAGAGHREQQPVLWYWAEQGRDFPSGFLKKGKISRHSEFSLLLMALGWGWV